MAHSVLKSPAAVMPPLVDPIRDHGDLANRLAQLRQLEREGVPASQTIEETLRAYEATR